MSKHERLSTEIVVKNHWLTIERHTVQAPDKRILPHDVYTFDMGDWVNVVALTPDDSFVMVKQHRFGIQADSLEIPGGIIEPGEDPRVAAERELLEETGYRAARWTSLGWVSPNPAVQGNRLHSFIAHECTLEREQQLDEMEDCRVVLLPRAHVIEAMRSNEIHHALVLVALQRVVNFNER